MVSMQAISIIAGSKTATILDLDETVKNVRIVKMLKSDYL